MLGCATYLHMCVCEAAPHVNQAWKLLVEAPIKKFTAPRLCARTKKRRTQKSHKSSSPKGRLNVWRGSMKLPQNGAKLFNIAFDCHILRWAWGRCQKRRSLAVSEGEKPETSVSDSSQHCCWGKTTEAVNKYKSMNVFQWFFVYVNSYFHTSSRATFSSWYQIILLKHKITLHSLSSFAPSSEIASLRSLVTGYIWWQPF